MFEGNLEDGELEIGKIAGMIHEIKSVQDIVNDIVLEFNHCKLNLQHL